MTISSDDEEGPAAQTLPSEPSEDKLPINPQKRSTGKLKAVKGSNKAQRPTPAPSTQDRSSQKSPRKAKSSKGKSKTLVKDPPKPNGRPIYSFFNAATQRQQTSQPSASPEKLSTPHEEPETIHDDSGDDQGSGLHLSKGSSTALAVRKRKVQYGDSFDSEVGLLPSTSQKFRKTSSGDRVSSLSIVNNDKRPWTEQFAPKDLSDLAVHKKKVADVRQWLEMTLNGRRQKVLVIKGAAGTGKTTTVRLLAQETCLQVTEWKNPAGGEFASEGSVSTTMQFEDFISRAGKSEGLRFTTGDSDELPANMVEQYEDRVVDDQRQLLLVEEFPNTFSRSSATLQSFRSAILQYLSSPTFVEGVRPTPIIMVISETLLSTNTALADSFTAHRLLGPELANHPFLDTIEFNAVAPTILTKALETVVIKEARKSGRRKTPGPQVLRHLAESGDIRSAVSSLEFLCLRGDDVDAWSSKVTFTKPKKAKAEPPLTKAEEEALKLISNREVTLGIFHAVGKVVYNKRIQSLSIAHPPPWLPQHRRDKIPENDVNDLIDELGTDTSTFIAALHENYSLSCSSASTEDTLDSLLGCVDNISDADLLSVDRFSYGTRAFSGSATDTMRQDEMAFQVAVRGMLFSLPSPVHRSMPADGKRGDAHRMFYPSSLKLWKKREEIEGVLDLLTAKVQAGTLTLTSQAWGEKAEASVKGVERWKRTSSLSQPSEQETSDTTVASMSSAKIEMLIERLPYTSQIVGSGRLFPTTLDQLATVTRIRGSTPPNEDEDADDDGDGDTGPEQWTTDQPDPEGASKPMPSKLKQTKSTKATEGGGLAIPVESRVDRLVLEDDDIIDD